jgi:hypothetical protein
MRDESGPGVPLAHHRQHRAGVRLTSRDCKEHRDLPLEAVIERPEGRWRGDERTASGRFADLVRRPCERCDGWRFSTTPACHPSQR